LYHGGPAISARACAATNACACGETRADTYASGPHTKGNDAFATSHNAS
jgi:hypothetical protein